MWETFIIQPMTNVLLWIYDVLGHGPHTFGLAIILFTILIRAITWPLNASQVKGAQAMQELQNDKDWQEIQKKYAKDREKLAQEQMRVYKEKGINPFASCLPTLIQFPIIIGLYQSITRALAATPLGLLQLSRSVYPFLDVKNIIPLNRSKLTMPASTNPNDQSAAMSGMMSIYMPLLLGWFALNFASGIAVYFITSNLLGVAQYAATGRANWRNLLPGGQKQPQTQKQIQNQKQLQKKK